MNPEFARQYYESATKEHWWFRGRRRLVAGLLDRVGTVSGRFLDLGAGSDSLFPDNLSVVKVDIVRPEPMPQLFVQALAEALPFESRTFDGVGLFDILEHLTDPSTCLSEVRRVARSGGVVLVTVPAYQWLWSPHDEHVGHRRRYDRANLVACLEQSGLAVSWVSAFYGFLLPPALVRKAFSLKSPMTMPERKLNGLLGRLAVRSAVGALERESAAGLSIGALAHVP